MTFDDDVAPVLRRLTGRVPASWTPVDEGAYSHARRWVVRWEGGGSAFVKAEAEPKDRYGVAVEQLVYSAVSAPCLPRLYAYGDGVLVTEDLSHARWGTPVTDADARALRAAFDVLSDVRAPAGLHPLTAIPGWASFADDPAPLLATGLADEPWLTRHLPALVDAESHADTSGDLLVHGDVWLQNWCRADRGAVVVDWAGCGPGNPMLMRAGGEAGVRAAGGPAGVVLSPGHAEWAALFAGQVAYFLLGTPADPRLHETLRREAVATLRWACEEVGLPYAEPAAALRGLGPWRP